MDLRAFQKPVNKPFFNPLKAAYGLYQESHPSGFAGNHLDQLIGSLFGRLHHLENRLQ